ncbi:MAG: diacylglycerol kinase family protein [Thermanaeromonas sp.]|uniref:diacylglycerol kinase family protein n=1 Tax=Thermanaeromonas sp. TaxID=2003697 RepID=UPI00243B65BD|nr:diacylglycerol kinase family protein [Thermanaeromonas sp.]MCG0277551.1 diacylglycerol kinase family protein [Thermanaeromonas sp.]
MINKFRAALAGLFYTLRTQVNMGIHLTAAAGVFFLGYYFRLEGWEWGILILTVAFVLAAETFNTALELAVNLSCPHYHPLARKAKDVAAGAVLVTALGAVATGLLIFLPRFLQIFNSGF